MKKIPGTTNGMASKFKYHDRVIIANGGFYQGAIGIVEAYEIPKKDEPINHYWVQLETTQILVKSDDLQKDPAYIRL